MAKQENIKAEGVITRDLSNGIVEVEILSPDGESTGHFARGTIGSRLRTNNVRLCVQDRVVLELSPYDLTLGRIIYRYNVGPNGEIIKKASVVNNNRNGKGKKKKSGKGPNRLAALLSFIFTLIAVAPFVLNYEKLGLSAKLPEFLRDTRSKGVFYYEEACLYRRGCGHHHPDVRGRKHQL